MRINVTSADIQAGVPSSPMECPIAIALRRYGTVVLVVGKISVISPPSMLFVRLPISIRKWIDDYDDGATCLPISFSLSAEFFMF